MKVNKVGFFHDHRFVSNQDTIYSTGGLPEKVWQRYLEHGQSLIVVGRKAALPEDFLDKGYSISSRENVSFKLTFDLGSPISFLKNRSHVIKDIKGVVREIDFAIIRLPSAIGSLAIKEMIQARKPYIVELVDCAFDGHWYHHNILRKMYAPFAYFSLRREVTRSPAVIYVTKHFLQERYPNKSHFKTNISNVELLTRQGSLVNHKSCQNTDVISIGMMGNLNNRLKGFEFGINLVQELNKCNDTRKFVLKIAGGGSPSHYQNMASRLGVQEYVKFEGALEAGERVFEWLDNLDFYFHPSKKEGLPRSIIEAMSCSLVCLGTPIAGIPELLEKDDLIKYGDLELAKNKIFNYVESSSKYRKKALRNKRVSEQYESRVLNKKRKDFFDGYIRTQFN